MAVARGRRPLLRSVLNGLLMTGLLTAASVAVAMPGPQASRTELRTEEIRLRNAMEQSPTNGRIRIDLATVYLRLGNYNAAVAELIVARQLRVKDGIVAPLLAQAMLSSGDLANLLHDIPAGDRPAKAESLVRTYRGLAQMGIGEADAAKASLSDAERLDPKNTAPKLALARLFLSQKNLAASEAKIDQVLAVAPADSAALEVKALILEFRGDASGAASFFNKALASQPQNVEALLDRASLEADHNQLGRAASDIAAAKAIAPNNAMASYVDAVVKAKTGHFKEADDALDKLRPMLERVPAAYLLAGEIKFRLGQTAQAEDYLTKALAHDQKQPQAYELLGVLELHRGVADRAVTLLEQAHALAPADSEIAVLLAQAYLTHGDANKAVDLMDEEIVHQPKNTQVASQRALSHFAAGEPGGSVDELGKLFRSGSGDLKAGPPLVMAQLADGKVADAAITAQTLSRRDPSNILFQELFGATLVAQRNYPAAETVFRLILAKHPSLLSARRSLAQVYLSSAGSGEATKLFEDWIAQHPADAKAMLALADIYIQTKDQARALQLLTKAKAAETGDLSAGLQVVTIYESQKKLAEALNAAGTLQKRFPKNQLVMDAVGRLYSKSGDAKASLAAYADATAAFPNAAPLWNNYATALAAAGNLPHALDSIAKAHALDPANLRYEQALVELTYRVRGEGAALALAHALDSNSPQTPVGTLLAATVLARQAKPAEAIALLQSAQEKTPSLDGATLLARLYNEQGQRPKAIAILESWTAKHPNDLAARYGLAQLYGSAGAFDKAQGQFEWLVARRPQDATALNNLAWLYSQRKDPRARAIAERAYKVAPQSAPVADTLGWILTSQGDAAGGLKYLQLAGHEAPQDASVQYHLAFALAKTNQAQTARPILQKLLSSGVGGDVRDSAKALLFKIGS